jgi:hypothetical protein
MSQGSTTPPGSPPSAKDAKETSEKTSTTPPGTPISQKSNKTDSSSAGKKRKQSQVDVDAKAAVPKKPAKQVRPAPPPPSRPTRTRKAPERLADLPPPAAKKAPIAKKTTSKVFDPTYITTNANSRLNKTDVFHMLLLPSAWAILTAPQKLTLLAYLRPNWRVNRLREAIANGTAPAEERPREFTINYDLFRTDVARYLESLGLGHLGKTWVGLAEQACREKDAGAFDWWKDAQAEAWWGQGEE